jgi:hypothetical protein
VNDSGSGTSQDDSGLSALPPELASQSLSRTAIILPVDAALQAIAHLSGTRRRLENWEGWVKMRDGGRAKSLAHAGSFALPTDAARAAEVASAGIRRTKAMWDRNPEYPGASLYIELTYRSA